MATLPEKMPLTPDQFRSIVQLTPLASLDLVIQDETEHVLVGLRNNEPAKGTYFVPGGIIRKNETLDQAFLRILSIETGLALSRREAEHIGLFEHFYSANRFGEAGYGTHYVVNAYRIRLNPRPSIVRDGQHAELRWLRPVELLADAAVHENTKAYFR